MRSTLPAARLASKMKTSLPPPVRISATVSARPSPPAPFRRSLPAPPTSTLSRLSPVRRSLPTPPTFSTLRTVSSSALPRRMRASSAPLSASVTAPPRSEKSAASMPAPPSSTSRPEPPRKEVVAAATRQRVGLRVPDQRIAGTAADVFDIAQRVFENGGERHGGDRCRTRRGACCRDRRRSACRFLRRRRRFQHCRRRRRRRRPPSPSLRRSRAERPPRLRACRRRTRYRCRRRRRCRRTRSRLRGRRCVTAAESVLAVEPVEPVVAGPALERIARGIGRCGVTETGDGGLRGTPQGVRARLWGIPPIGGGGWRAGERCRYQGPALTAGEPRKCQGARCVAAGASPARLPAGIRPRHDDIGRSGTFPDERTAQPPLNRAAIALRRERPASVILKPTVA